MPKSIKPLFPKIEPYDQGFLKVSETHELYYEQSGKKDGIPVVFFHGGPGDCTEPKNRQLFDPKVFRIILFDQRGAGQSKPHGSLIGNTTQDLIDDIEKLRIFLNIDKWMLFGGSWGSTLALLYAQTRPAHVLGMVVRSIFLGEPKNCDWMFGKNGAARIFPETYKKFIEYLPEDERDDPLPAYNKYMNEGTHEERAKAAVTMLTYEASILAMEDTMIQKAQERLEGEAEMSAIEKREAQQWFENFALTHCRIENHYNANKHFLEDDQILNNMDALQGIPSIIIHGRYDLICPYDNAYRLHEAWDGSELITHTCAGHSGSEMVDIVVDAIRRMSEKLL